jgi:hypothetical protein
VRGDRRGEGFGAEELWGLAGTEVTERIDGDGGWSEPGALKTVTLGVGIFKPCTATGVNIAAIHFSVCDND